MKMNRLVHNLFQLLLLLCATVPFARAQTSACYCTFSNLTPVFRATYLTSAIVVFVPRNSCFTGRVVNGWLTVVDHQNYNIPEHSVTQTDSCANSTVKELWDVWSEWSDDNESGIQTRFRTCLNDQIQCVGNNREIRDLETYFYDDKYYEDDYDDDGSDVIVTLDRREAEADSIHWTAWTSWSPCGGECWENGSRYRSRACFSLYTKGILPAEICDGSELEYKKCYLDCYAHPLSPWSSWTYCPDPCDQQFSHRSRQCRVDTCNETVYENKLCSLDLCQVDGGWTEWTAWRGCNGSDGVSVRFRNCSNPLPEKGGNDCDGTRFEFRSCDGIGFWGEWGEWSDCFGSINCSAGVKFRMHSCSVNGTCPGPDYERTICAADGCHLPGWTEWTPWSACLVTCGNGARTRNRTCYNPDSNNKTLTCPGNSVDAKVCATNQPCPVDGEFMEWSDWAQCSVSCGYGEQSRSRSCSTPQFGGENCQGDFTDKQPCNVATCPVDGHWALWTTWSDCSVTCNNGSRIRDRACTDPAPLHGGDNCTDDVGEQSEPCSRGTCPVDGVWSGWSEWSNCNCNGERTRLRLCDNPPKIGNGADCVGPDIEKDTCAADLTANCPVDGAWTQWYPWSACNITCGSGTVLRVRTCTNPKPDNGGEFCDGGYIQNKPCSKAPCPVDGGWSSWLSWNACDATCGTGSYARNRTCDHPMPQYGGNNCTGSETEIDTCAENPCPIDGDWSTWGGWSMCDVTCGVGTRMRNHTCNNPLPQHGGHLCAGQGNTYETCQLSPCPIDGNWGVWAGWSTCSVTCEAGIQSRVRECDDPLPKYNGRYCAGSHNETQICIPRDTCIVDGGWSDWTPWSECTMSCGPGEKTHYHICDNPKPENGGKYCEGEYFETVPCSMANCAIDGEWSSWGSFGECSVTCASGMKERYRTCSDPKPMHGGQKCVGNGTDITVCVEPHCPVAGAWSGWLSWGACSATCGNGTAYRNRTCDSPAPAYNGTQCPGNDTGQEMCLEKPCPIDGSWSEWSSWDKCSVTCGDGTQNRARICSNPAPQHGGKHCPGIFTESTSCPSSCCPVDGAWGSWFGWTACLIDGSCPSGTRQRIRACNNPISACGGVYCQGNARQSDNTCLPHNCTATSNPVTTTAVPATTTPEPITLPTMPDTTPEPITLPTDAITQTTDSATTTDITPPTDPVTSPPAPTASTTTRSTKSTLGPVTATSPHTFTKLTFTTAPSTPAPPVNFSCTSCAIPNSPSLCFSLTKPTLCPEHYCINEVTNNEDGSSIIDRRCGTWAECTSDWWHTTSDNPDCTSYDVDANVRKDIHCTYCCTKENCNTDVVPKSDTLFVKPRN